MKQGMFIITENVPLTDTVFRMRLRGDTSAVTGPGQFVNIRLESRYLRRPISVCDCRGDTITLLYKVVGHGTGQMSRMPAGTELDLLTGLGNGFACDVQEEHMLLLGGGIGTAPLYWLAKDLIARGKQVTVILGFNTAAERFYEREFAELGAETVVCTADGSYGVRGFVTDAMQTLSYDYCYVCGPEPMLKAVWQSCRGGGQFSFESRMGCGFGACMGCSCKTITGYKRICKDGPVLQKEEILWEV